MRAKVICVVTIFFAMVAATALGNPIWNTYELISIVPGDSGHIDIMLNVHQASIDSIKIGDEYAVFERNVPMSNYPTTEDSFYMMNRIQRYSAPGLLDNNSGDINFYSTVWVYPDSFDVFQGNSVFRYGDPLYADILSLRYNNLGWVRPKIPDGMYLICGGHRLYFADSHWEWLEGVSLKSLPQPDTLPERVPDLINEIHISEFKPLGSGRFVELWSPVPYSLDGWMLFADGFHVFESTDIVDGCFVLYEEDWDDGFDIGDSCGQLILLGPGMVCAKAFSWNGLSDTSVSGNALRDCAGWIDSTAWALPTPGHSTLSISERGVSLPSAVSILTLQPNPFNSSATIGYELAKGVSSATLDIFDINGRLISSRDLSDTRSGYHETKISALPASGTYLVRIETNRGSAEGKIIYLK